MKDLELSAASLALSVTSASAQERDITGPITEARRIRRPRSAERYWRAGETSFCANLTFPYRTTALRSANAAKCRPGVRASPSGRSRRARRSDRSGGPRGPSNHPPPPPPPHPPPPKPPFPPHFPLP